MPTPVNGRNASLAEPIERKPVVTKMQGGLFLGTIGIIGLLLAVYAGNDRFSSLMNRSVQPVGIEGIPIGIIVIICITPLVLGQVLFAIGRYSRKDSELTQRIVLLEEQLESDKEAHDKELARVKKEAETNQAEAQGKIDALQLELTQAQTVRAADVVQQQILNLQESLDQAQQDKSALARQLKRETREKNAAQMKQAREHLETVRLEQEVRDVKALADQAAQDDKLQQEALQAFQALQQFASANAPALQRALDQFQIPQQPSAAAAAAAANAMAGGGPANVLGAFNLPQLPDLSPQSIMALCAQLQGLNIGQLGAPQQEALVQQLKTMIQGLGGINAQQVEPLARQIVDCFKGAQPDVVKLIALGKQFGIDPIPMLASAGVDQLDPMAMFGNLLNGGGGAGGGNPLGAFLNMLAGGGGGAGNNPFAGFFGGGGN